VRRLETLFSTYVKTKDTALPANRDPILSFVYLMKESFKSWNQIRLDRNSHTILRFDFMANRKQKDQGSTKITESLQARPDESLGINSNM